MPSFFKVVVVLMIWALALSASGTAFWVLLSIAVAVTLYAASRLRYLYGAPWRRLYFPMFRAYLRDAMITGRSDSPEKRLTRLLPAFLPSVDSAQAELLVQNWTDSFATFLEDPFYRELILHNGGDRPAEEKLAAFGAWLELPANRNSYLVRYAFGNVIEQHAGEQQKRQFWRAVLANQLP